MSEHQWLLDSLRSEGIFIFAHIGWLLLASWLLGWWMLWRWGQVGIGYARHRYLVLSEGWQRQNWRQQHPTLIAFVGARFSTTQLTGLPLTLMTLVFVALCAMLAGLVEAVVMSETVVTLDELIATSMAQVRTESVVSIFHAITLLGNATFVLPVFISIIAGLWWFGQRHIVLVLGVSFVGSLGTSLIGKWAFHRPRPLEAVLSEHSFSFPSSHATLAVAFYGLLCYWLWRQVRTWNQHVLVAFVGFSLAALLGISRLVLGVHFMSDVLAGYLLGGLWLLIGVSLLEWQPSQQKTRVRS